LCCFFFLFLRFYLAIVAIVARLCAFRPLPELLAACQDKIADAGHKFRSEELLQLVCELCVHPETYEALGEIFDSFAPLPVNYMSDEEIEGEACVR
jgi:hypothetical protein